MAQKNELQETARIDALFEKVSLCRRFFMVYSNSVNSDYPIQKEIGKQRLSNSSAVLTNLNVVNSHCPEFSLSWSIH